MENQEEKVVDLRERVTLYALEDNPEYKAGTPVQVGALIADKLIDRKWFTKDKPEAVIKAEKAKEAKEAKEQKA